VRQLAVILQNYIRKADLFLLEVVGAERRQWRLQKWGSPLKRRRYSSYFSHNIFIRFIGLSDKQETWFSLKNINHSAFVMATQCVYYGVGKGLLNRLIIEVNSILKMLHLMFLKKKKKEL
jgi:hypothetical protein